MGIFDVFKSKKKKTLGTFHGMDLREWNDGYKSDNKGIAKFINTKLKSISEKEFIDFLKKKESYRKFDDEEANNTMNKLTITEPKGTGSLGLTKFGFVFYPKSCIEKDISAVGFRIVDTDFTYSKEKGMKQEKAKTFIILTVDKIQKDQDYWKKKINWDHRVMTIGFQFIDLDEDEYELLKPFEKKFKEIKDDSWETWGDFLKVHDALFSTEKRKAYPINRFQTYLGFFED